MASGNAEKWGVWLREFQGAFSLWFFTAVLLLMKSADLELVRRIRQGDDAAWRDLISQFEGRLLAFAKKKLHDFNTCKDLVQESFLGFYSSLDLFQENQSLQSYLFSILSHKIIDHFRKESRRKTQTMEDSPSGSDFFDRRSNGAAGVTTWYQIREMRMAENAALVAALSDYLKSLVASSQYLKVKTLELIWVVGISNLEAAQLLGIGNQDVANIRFQAIRSLKEFLQEKRVSPDFFPALEENGGA